MTLKRTETGEVSTKVQVYRNGELVKNKQGATDLNEFIRGIEIYESITSATMEGRLVFQDNAGLIDTFTGSELFKISINGSVYENTYYMRAYNIESRSRTNQSSEVYIINLASDEYVKNEIANVFGNTEVIFNKDISSKNVLETLIKNTTYLGSKREFMLKIL